MRDRELNPSESHQNQPIWKIAECAAVSASVVGVFASVISAQVAYFAAPVSLSLCLNLINRYRWEKQSQSISVGMARMYRRIDEMEQSALTLPPMSNPHASELASAWQALEELQELTNERLDRLSREQSQIHLRLSQISSQTAEIERQDHRRLTPTNSPVLPLYSANGNPNSSLLKDLQNRLAKLEELDLASQQSTLAQLKQLIQASPSLEQRLQEQEALVAQIHERLTGLEGLEVENQLLEVLQLHLRLYKWQQELTAEINQRLTPVVVEMQLGKQRQLALETKIAELGVLHERHDLENGKEQQSVTLLN